MTIFIICAVIFTLAWAVAVGFWIATLARVWRVLSNLEKISETLAEDTKLASGLLKGFSTAVSLPLVKSILGSTFSLVGFLFNRFKKKSAEKE